jgi:hypothetical protein
MQKPDRTPWTTTALKTVDIIADTRAVQGHPVYQAAKQGDPDAALQLVSSVLDAGLLDRLQEQYGERLKHVVDEWSVR